MLKIYFCTLKKFLNLSKSNTVAYLVLSFLAVFLSLLELYLTQSLVTSIQNLSHEGYVVSIIYKLLLLLILLLYVNGTLGSLRAISMANLLELGGYEEERMILDKVSKLAIEDLDSPHIKSLTEKAKKVDLFELVNGFTDFITNSLTCVIFTGVLLRYKSLYIVLIIYMTLIIHSYIQKKSMIRKELIEQGQVSSKRIVTYLFDLLVNRETLPEIKLYRIMPYLKNKKQSIFNNNFKEKMSMIKKNELLMFLANVLVSFSNLLCLVLLIIIIGQNGYKAGVFVMLLQITAQMFGLLNKLSQGYSNVKALEVLFIEYKRFLDLEEVPPINAKHLPFTTDRKQMEVRITNLDFSYPEGKNTTLNNINLSIKPGEKVAFVGKNGSGKSTLIKVILGLYAPQKGCVKYLFNDSELTTPQAMAHTRVVFQDYLKLLRPVRENIALGEISELENHDKLKEALIKTKAHSYVKDLDIYIGPEFGGCDFSGGQWQKLAISRAYMRQAALGVFDEATAALDPEAELEQFQGFLSIEPEVTTIIVTHRLSITKLVDKIVVLDKGRIVQYGSHEELYNQGGIYSEMYDSQTALYG